MEKIVGRNYVRLIPKYNRSLRPILYIQNVSNEAVKLRYHLILCFPREFYSLQVTG